MFDFPPRSVTELAAGQANTARLERNSKSLSFLPSGTVSFFLVKEQAIWGSDESNISN